MNKNENKYKYIYAFTVLWDSGVRFYRSVWWGGELRKTHIPHTKTPRLMHTAARVELSSGWLEAFALPLDHTTSPDTALLQLWSRHPSLATTNPHLEARIYPRGVTRQKAILFVSSTMKGKREGNDSLHSWCPDISSKQEKQLFSNWQRNEVSEHPAITCKNQSTTDKMSSMGNFIWLESGKRAFSKVRLSWSALSVRNMNLKHQRREQASCVSGRLGSHSL